ncbi:hypothetical protein BCIN_08g02570 [Botrytis cinerea B05.10]|uniref:Ketoreductase (KR) domain-containing protein n=1 Tax=Botryotinia fuckeliana (strain B05.10) TaxID=332648 RepID=A0A384JQC8_BOTFB|nr:hypothetical protein BCIN_08g02570 [Botrytis cinerea B05.10]ATZ52587.1 hypothetical protein BCIN_08g02570 [Botrytis cinerea B05.10]
MPRSGCDDDISQSVLFQLKALETDVVVIKGDVVKLDDVRVALQRAIKPIAGIVQGVMLLRTKATRHVEPSQYCFSGGSCAGFLHDALKHMRSGWADRAGQLLGFQFVPRYILSIPTRTRLKSSFH